MSFFRFDPNIDASPRTVTNIVRAAVAIGTPNAWREKDEQCRAIVERNPMMRGYVEQRFELATTIAAMARRARRGFSLSPRRLSDPEVRALNFATALVRLHENVAPRAKSQIESRLAGALNDKGSTDLPAIEFELQALVNLMHRGVEVECAELEGTANFDFLARKDGLAVAIECKTFSTDIGRKIHAEKMHRLGGFLLDDLRREVSAGLTALIEIVIPDRLGGDLSAIAKCAGEAIRTRSTRALARTCTVDLRPFSLFDSPFYEPNNLSEDTVRDFVSTKFGLENKSIMLFGQAKQGVLIILVRSERPDAVRAGMQDRLKRATTQLPDDRPAVISAQLLDMAGPELIELRDASRTTNRRTEMRALLEWLFGSESRKHIHSVSFSGVAEIGREERIEFGKRVTTIGEGGVLAYWENQNHKLVGDQRMKAFI
jgi:hypothetical protein